MANTFVPAACLQHGATPPSAPLLQPVACRHMQALLRCRGFDLAEEHQCLLVDLQDCALEDLPPCEARDAICMLCCVVPLVLCCAVRLVRCCFANHSASQTRISLSLLPNGWMVP